MKKDSEQAKLLLLGFCVLILSFFSPSLIPAKISQSVNDLSSWYVYSLTKKPAAFSKIVAVGIDDYSLNKAGLRWPWKRAVYASLLNKLGQEGVKAIGLDFVFVGESENPEDDLALSQALSNTPSRVVLAYLFDAKNNTPVFPLAGLRKSAYSSGMLNTPSDADGKIRRLRAYIESEGNTYYSFSVILASAFLGKAPQEIVQSMPLLENKTFYLNYLLRPQDIIRVSFWDITENLEQLKKRFGDNFLRGSLVIVYPDAKIMHDTVSTPLGEMPGGLLHLNGIAGIMSGRFIKEEKALGLAFLIISFTAVFFILKSRGLVTGVFLTLGVLIFNLWALVLAGLAGKKFDYSAIFTFIVFYFFSGSLYKYFSFLAQILKIKDKATLDPLRGLFTLRYFFYRLDLESKKIYLHKNPYLVFIRLESIKDLQESMPLEDLKALWAKISGLLSAGGNFWSVYSEDELAGCIFSREAKVKNEIEALIARLEALLAVGRVKAGYAKFKKDYPLHELLFILDQQARKQKEKAVFFEEPVLAGLLRAALPEEKNRGALLESLDQDIEDKNRQLLSMINELLKEHAKTKEAFFQIITSLVNALEARDAYTEGHSERVAAYSLKVADKLGWDNEKKEKLKKAALLHDLGKIGIPDRILHKRASLTPEEFDEIKKHEIIGVKILEPLTEFKEILPWILYHHERWDGKGYPHGLGGETIPEEAQIISLADVYDALTTGRDYKEAFTQDFAVGEIIKDKGARFNPRLADIFLEAVCGRPKSS